MEHRNETCLDIIKLKHVQKGENVIVCKNRNKILSVVKQARQLKNALVGKLGMLLCTR